MQTVVMPTMTTMAAPTMTTVQAPMVGTAVATPMMVPRTPSYVPPPPQMIVQRPSYVAPPVMETVVQRPSYVPPPAMMAAPTMPAVLPAPIVSMPPPAVLPASLPVPQAPGAPPPKLTAGIPDPAQIEKQKLAYAAGLDKQLNDAVLTVQNETKIEKEMVAFKTQKDIALFETQVDEKLVEQLAMEDERAALMTSQLKKATVERSIALNQQAASLVMDYNMKITLDDIAMKKRQFEQQYVTQEMKLANDFNATVMKAGPMYAAPPPAVVV